MKQVNDNYFMTKAKYVAECSSVERIKVGCVFLDTRSSQSINAFNNEKAHAEENALFYDDGHNLFHGDTLYIYPVLPCPRCAKLIISRSVERVVVYYNPNAAPAQRECNVEESLRLLREADVRVDIIKEVYDREA